MLTVGELEILKSALEGDISRQREYLEDIDDLRFEVWLTETEMLYKKIIFKLSDEKARQQGGSLNV